jgi:hypothetical protein
MPVLIGEVMEFPQTTEDTLMSLAEYAYHNPSQWRPSQNVVLPRASNFLAAALCIVRPRVRLRVRIRIRVI